MPDERQEETAQNENEAKPTITIAEKEGSTSNDAKPTITIAEKEGGK